MPLKETGTHMEKALQQRDYLLPFPQDWAGWVFAAEVKTTDSEVEKLFHSFIGLSSQAFPSSPFYTCQQEGTSWDFWEERQKGWRGGGWGKEYSATLKHTCCLGESEYMALADQFEGDNARFDKGSINAVNNKHNHCKYEEDVPTLQSKWTKTQFPKHMASS